MLSGITRKLANLTINQNSSHLPLIFRNAYAAKPPTKKASDFIVWSFGTGRNDADKVYIARRKTDNVDDVKAYLKIAKEDLGMKGAIFRTIGERQFPIADISIHSKNTLTWVFSNLNKLGNYLNQTLPESKAWYRDLQPEEIEKLAKIDKNFKGLDAIYNLFNTENDINALQEYKKLITDFDKLNISKEACPVVEVAIPDHSQTANLPQSIKKELLSNDPLAELIEKEKNDIKRPTLLIFTNSEKTIHAVLNNLGNFVPSRKENEENKDAPEYFKPKLKA